VPIGIRNKKHEKNWNKLKIVGDKKKEHQIKRLSGRQSLPNKKHITEIHKIAS
jgi:hypothetical protein